MAAAAAIVAAAVVVAVVLCLFSFRVLFCAYARSCLHKRLEMMELKTKAQWEERTSDPRHEIISNLTAH